jgi:hypothetical protein
MGERSVGIGAGWLMRGRAVDRMSPAGLLNFPG